MKKTLAVALVASLPISGATMAGAADLTTYEAPQPQAYQPAGPEGGVRIGFLDCQIGGGIGYLVGSAKSVDCTFRPVGGNAVSDTYSGTIRKVGVDVGFTSRTRLVWAVFAPTAGYHEGSLGGLYEGATAEATLGLGIGANLLVGGTENSVHLQPASVTGQVGLNIAAAGTSMTLNAVN